MILHRQPLFFIFVIIPRVFSEDGYFVFSVYRVILLKPGLGFRSVIIWLKNSLKVVCCKFAVSWAKTVKGDKLKFLRKTAVWSHMSCQIEDFGSTGPVS